MSEIITAGPLKFSEPNCPTRVGEIVENIEDIYSIPTPRLGMMVFVKNKGRHYTITSLKSAVIGGVEVQNAQVDSFEPVAIENVGNVDSLDGFTDNGIYQGYHVVSGEVFVLVVINNHAVAAQMGMPTISQFKYSVNMRGQVSFEQRTKDSVWGEWCKVNEPWIVSQLEEIERNLFDYINKSIKDVTDGIDPEKIDSLKDLIAWVEEHGGTVNALWKSIEENAGRITSEIERAKQAEDELGDAIQLNYEDIKRLDANKAERSDAMHYDTLGVSTYADKAEIYGRSISGTPRTCDFPAATTEKAGVMSAEDKKEQVKKTPLVNGDIIAGQAREIHSRNGKTVTDSFLVRTTAGSGTIGDGVASLKSVGGNIVKNLVDGTFESGWTGRYTVANGVSHIKPYSTFDGSGFPVAPISSHKYYISAYVNTPKTIIMRYGVDRCAQTFDKWHILSNIVTNVSHNRITFICSSTLVNFFVRNPLLIDLTEMYGAGNEPTLEECDKMFGTMDALPQGLNFANPTEFKSTGFNQFNPENVLEGKAIVDNIIVNGDKKIAVIPCLPCKVGVGENNGYCIHGEFGDDIKVYLTPLNPMEVEGELYMHELTKDATTDTYVPQIKGYMLVEVPTTANLCAHFLWSEDKCERDTYEPYFESKVELPVIPQMSEWGLAGIQSSGTLVCDEIDFERGVYVKRIGSVDLGNVVWAETSMSANGYKTQIVDMADQGDYNQSLICKKYTTCFENTDGSIYATLRIVVVPLAKNKYPDAASFKASMQGVILYYELATPEEYPLPKVTNNYISSDYGVEQFDSAVPCNANNLYYMRSLAGETRNFLDRLYDNTDKTDAKEVADYITSGIESNKELATNAPNLALRALFIAAGAEYNDTEADKNKTAPWGETVTHKAGHYYLNGLGDITEEEMMEIYNCRWQSSGIIENTFTGKSHRTFINQGSYSASIKPLRYTYYQCRKMITAVIKGMFISDMEGAFTTCEKLEYIYPAFNVQHVTSSTKMAAFGGCKELKYIKLIGLKISVAFKDSAHLRKDCVLDIIKYAAPTSALTITLHPDAYARLENDADIVAALAAQPLVTLVSA